MIDCCPVAKELRSLVGCSLSLVRLIDWQLCRCHTLGTWHLYFGASNFSSDRPVSGGEITTLGDVEVVRR